jgi:NADH-quinone oxidoreductase subunit L
MLELVWLIPALPLAGFLVLALAPRLPRAAAGTVGVGSVGLAALLTLILGVNFLSNPPPGNAYTQTLWTWLSVGSFHSEVALRLDSLSLLMAGVVTWIGFLIHLYSAEFMADDAGYRRFFAGMNLFVASMLVLVLAADLLLLYLGWEGVGLCSYLLIGFWYDDPANGRAARKAFLVTRIGDTAMILGVFVLYLGLGTLGIDALMQRAQAQWPVGSPWAVTAAALLLGGALGKSAQLPLQTWLPDAMAGPTPTSALIHAATMVTAGVYLIARTHVLFTLAPPVLHAVAVIGTLTMLLASFSALVQRDIKRCLAYSTMSQIGLMFLALGVGAWSAAMFHFFTHACFKALLFLAAGVVILAMHHEHDMFQMGGLRTRMPLVFWTFLAGVASLSALPLVTAGFYSKEFILAQAYGSPLGGFWFWLAATVGAVLTSLYSFRMVFLVFYGPLRHEPVYRPGLRMAIPLVVLAVLSLIVGCVEMHLPGLRIHAFSRFMGQTLPPELHETESLASHVMWTIAVLASLGGVVLAWQWFFRLPNYLIRLRDTRWAPNTARLWLAGWGFDWVYERLLVRPYVWLARTDRDDVIDSIYDAVAAFTERLHTSLRTTQTGRLAWYATGVALGAVILVTIMVWR